MRDEFLDNDLNGLHGIHEEHGWILRISLSFRVRCMAARRYHGNGTTHGSEMTFMEYNYYPEYIL